MDNIRAQIRIDNPPKSDCQAEDVKLTKRGSLKVNKNFLNAPFARDARASSEWRWSEKLNRWLCDMRGNSDIQLRLPRKAKRSNVTAFDMAVLFLVLAETQKRKRVQKIVKSRFPNSKVLRLRWCTEPAIETEVKFRSRTAMLIALGYSATTRNIRKLNDALVLWSNLVIRYKQWYFPKDRDPYGPRKLPPPFELVEGTRISVSREWCQLLDSGYFADVYLPLPKGAAAQNLVLMLFAHSDMTELRRRVRPLCRKIGLHNNDSAEKLRHAFSEVDDWFWKRLRWYLNLYWPAGAHVLDVSTMNKAQLYTEARLADFEEEQRLKSQPKETSNDGYSWYVEEED